MAAHAEHAALLFGSRPAAKLIATEALPGILEAKVFILSTALGALLNRHIVGTVVNGLEGPAVDIIGPARLVRETPNRLQVGAGRIRQSWILVHIEPVAIAAGLGVVAAAGHSTLNLGDLDATGIQAGAAVALRTVFNTEPTILFGST